MSSYGIIQVVDEYKVISSNDIEDMVEYPNIFCTSGRLLSVSKNKLLYHMDECECQYKDTKEYIQSKLNVFQDKYIVNKKEMEENRIKGIIILILLCICLLWQGYNF